jgi:hypothetical protein
VSPSTLNSARTITTASHSLAIIAKAATVVGLPGVCCAMFLWGGNSRKKKKKKKKKQQQQVVVLKHHLNQYTSDAAAAHHDSSNNLIYMHLDVDCHQSEKLPDFTEKFQGG